MKPSTRATLKVTQSQTGYLEPDRAWASPSPEGRDLERG